MWQFDYTSDGGDIEKYARISWPKPGAGCGDYYEDDNNNTCFVYGGRLKLNYQGHEYPVYEVILYEYPV